MIGYWILLWKAERLGALQILKSLFLDGLNLYLDYSNGSVAMRNGKAEELGGESEQYSKIPDNMFIWATMNSADQGVFPMDTAFKRR